MSDKQLVNKIAWILGERLPAAALLTMPGTKTIYAIAEAIAEGINPNKHSGITSPISDWPLNEKDIKKDLKEFQAKNSGGNVRCDDNGKVIEELSCGGGSSKTSVGIPIVIDPRVPEGEAHIKDASGKTVGVITDISTER